MIFVCTFAINILESVAGVHNVRPHATLGNKLCGRAHIFKVDYLSKKDHYLYMIKKRLNLNKNFAQKQKFLLCSRSETSK